MAKKKLKAHPYADLFPMMTGTELEALAADIEENGLRNPIVLYGGQILDGRNRLQACEKAGVEPDFSEFDGDDAGAMALVISLNVQRRDLNAAQRAIVAAKTWMAGGDTTDKGKRSVSDKNTSIRTVASQFNTSTATITQARDLLTEAPDLAQQVEVRTLSLAAAYEELKKRRAEAKQKERDAERVKKYSDAISSGEMTFEEAFQKVLEDEREEKEIEKSQADARGNYLRKLVDVISHIETFMNHEFDKDGFDGKWFFEDGPGQFDHGLTFDRITQAANTLNNVAKHAKGTGNGKK